MNELNNPVVRYDELSDTLTVVFAMSETATGVELNDHIFLRINKNQRLALSLSLLDYSLGLCPSSTDANHPERSALENKDELVAELRAQSKEAADDVISERSSATNAPSTACANPFASSSSALGALRSGCSQWIKAVRKLSDSLLVQPDELGVRQFPLTGLAALSDELRNIVINMLKSAPINNYLALSVYTPSFSATSGAIPIVSVKSVLVAA